MRFTVLLTDRNETGDLRLLFDAGFKYKAYLSYWHKVFYPDGPAVVEYIKAARLFCKREHFVLVVLLEDYAGSALAVAHYVRSGSDLKQWIAAQGRAPPRLMLDTIRLAVAKVARRLHLSGPVLRHLRADVLCCARLGVIKIERVRHAESDDERKLRVLVTEIDKFFGSITCEVTRDGALFRVQVATQHRKNALRALIQSLGLSKGLAPVHDSAQSLVEGDAVKGNLVLEPTPASLLGKRSHFASVSDDDVIWMQVKRFKFDAPGDRDEPFPGNGSANSVLGKRKRSLGPEV